MGRRCRGRVWVGRRTRRRRRETKVKTAGADGILSRGHVGYHAVEAAAVDIVLEKDVAWSRGGRVMFHVM
jgi:hypothetical protein